MEVGVGEEVTLSAGELRSRSLTLRDGSLTLVQLQTIGGSCSRL